MSTAVYLETGSKRVFACALEWPGWARSGKDEDASLAALAAYADRYRVVTERAGVRLAKRAGDDLTVVERVEGSGATDFGVPGTSEVAADDRPLTTAAAHRLADLVEASWAVFDDVVAGAPRTLRKGPRGGGRDRDEIVEHARDAEAAYATKIGLKPADRASILDVLRAARRPAPPATASGRATPWTYRYAARRIAWHVLDHAWEIEDRST